MSNKLAKDDTLQSVATANNSIATNLNTLGKDTSLQSIATALNTLNTTLSNGAGGGGDTTVNMARDTTVTISGGNNTINNNGGTIYTLEDEAVYNLLLSRQNFTSGWQTAEAHNLVFRDESLGTTITAAQSEAIRSGNFEGIYPGMYWEREITYINSEDGSSVTATVKMRIMHLDYKLNKYNTQHHVLVVPDAPLYLAKYCIQNTYNSPDGGYKQYTQYEIFSDLLAGAAGAFLTFFGNEHVYTHTSLLPVRYYSLSSSVYTYVMNYFADRICDLMTARMIWDESNTTMTGYAGVFSTTSSPTEDRTQLAGFRLNSNLIYIDTQYWLQTIYSSYNNMAVRGINDANYNNASRTNLFGVRPYALIY